METNKLQLQLDKCWVKWNGIIYDKLKVLSSVTTKEEYTDILYGNLKSQAEKHAEDIYKSLNKEIKNECGLEHYYVNNFDNNYTDMFICGIKYNALQTAAKLNQNILFNSYEVACNLKKENCTGDVIEVYASPTGQILYKRIHSIS